MGRRYSRGIIGVVLVGIFALSMGARPPIRASQGPSAPISAAVVGGGFGGEKEDPMTRAPVVHLAARPMSPAATRTWLKLQEKLDMPFEQETPLEDVIKYIGQKTADPKDFPEGIPFYLHPAGLREAEKTPTSSVTLNLKGIPLATTLKLILEQHDLAYHIQDDGILIVTNKDNDHAPVEAEGLILDNLSALRAEVRALREEIQTLRRGGVPEPNPDGRPSMGPTGGMGTKGGMM